MGIRLGDCIVSDRDTLRPDLGVSFTDEILPMARLLEAQHGPFAAEIADFFVAANDCDDDRATAWSDIAGRIRLRTRLRLHVATATD